MVGKNKNKMSVVVKRAIFYLQHCFKSQCFSTQWYLHQERTTLPNRKAVRSTDTDKIEKEKMMKIQNGSYASGKPENQLYPGFLHNYLFYDRIELIPAGVYFFSLFQVHDLSWFLRRVHSVDVN